MREVFIFDRKEVELWLKFKEKKEYEIKEFLKKCGTFTQSDYIIYSDETEKSSPLQNLVKFLKEKYGSDIMENFFSLKHKYLTMKVEKNELEEKFREFETKRIRRNIKKIKRI